MTREPDGPVRQGGRGHGGDDPDEGWGETLSLLARVTGVGWYVAASILAGTVGGYFLDRWLGTAPWLLVVGLVLGSLVAFTGMIGLLRRFGSEKDDAH